MMLLEMNYTSVFVTEPAKFMLLSVFPVLPYFFPNLFVLFLNGVLCIPDLLQTLLSWGWPWTIDASASVFQMLGLFASLRTESRQELYQLSHTPRHLTTTFLFCFSAEFYYIARAGLKASLCCSLTNVRQAQPPPSFVPSISFLLFFLLPLPAKSGSCHVAQVGF